MTREALIKSKSFRERFWKDPQVSRWGFLITNFSWRADLDSLALLIREALVPPTLTEDGIRFL